MTKRRPPDRDEPRSPLEEEMAQAASADSGPDRTVASASAEEVAAASIFTEETAGAEEAPPAGPQDVALQAELAELKAKADEYLDGWQRSRAEFANYKKRIEREQDEARGRAAAALLSKILPIEDDLLRAVRERPAGDGEALRSWSEGIELIQRKLAALLEAEGVAVIEAEGAVFDPLLHEAVTYEANDDHNEGQIIEVIQPGYRLGERVLRPARVRVAR